MNYTCFKIANEKNLTFQHAPFQSDSDIKTYFCKGLFLSTTFPSRASLYHPYLLSFLFFFKYTFFCVEHPNAKIHESHHYTFYEIGRAVQEYPLKLDYYQHEEIYAGTDQIEDLSNTLRDIDEARYRALIGLFRN